MLPIGRGWRLTIVCLLAFGFLIGTFTFAGFEIAAEGIATYLPGGVPFSPTLAALAATAGAFGALRAASCSPRRSLWGALVLGGSVLAWSMRGLTGV